MMYDTMIIGAGPAGMTAALYAARSNLKVALLERGIYGGQMNNTAEIENYPGYARISGPELAEKMFEPLENLGVEHLFGQVEKIEDHGDFKKIITEDEVFETKTVILAPGANHRHLGVPGEEEYNSRGVSYCAVCDGAFFRDEDLLVVGGGDSAVEEAIFLTRFAKSVTIVHRRDQLRAQKLLQERAFVKDLGICDEAGWIVTDQHMKTAIDGIYAIGDVRQKDLRQITTAVGDGAVAGQEVYKYITEH